MGGRESALFSGMMLPEYLSQVEQLVFYIVTRCVMEEIRCKNVAVVEDGIAVCHRHG